MSIQEARRAAFKIWHDAQVSRLLEHNEPTAARVWRDFEGMHWNAWNAALDSAVVDLPLLENFKNDESAHSMLVVCREAIQRSGIRVEMKS